MFVREQPSADGGQQGVFCTEERGRALSDPTGGNKHIVDNGSGIGIRSGGNIGRTSSNRAVASAKHHAASVMGRRLGKYLLSSRRARRESEGIELKHGRDLRTNQSVTVKVFDTRTFTKAECLRELIKFEVGTMSKTNGHPNVVQLLDVLASPTKIFVVMETVSGGDLFDAIAGSGR